ncbi:MAG: peptidase [Betaproteobacteria bacterium]|nr:MAG: peptidase [Betaproteobacteria bacterium]
MTRGLSRALVAAGFLFSTGHAPAADWGRLLNVVPDLVQTAGISEQDEIAIGREVAGRVLGAAPLVADDALQAYVNTVGRWIAAQSERRQLPWRFGVIDSMNINAFAAPGGIVLITRGLYEMLENEAQLAGVLGHEIGHIVKRHHVSVMQKSAALSAGAKLVQGQARNELVQRLVGNGAEVFARSLDKSAEFEADRLGVILAARAGYSPYALADVLHHIAARSAVDGTLALLYKTHPNADERLEHLGDAVAPRVESLPVGAEPSLQRIGAVAAEPAAATPRADAQSSAQPVQSESPQSAVRPQAPAVDPARVLRGLFGR